MLWPSNIQDTSSALGVDYNWALLKEIKVCSTEENTPGNVKFTPLKTQGNTLNLDEYLKKKLLKAQCLTTGGRDCWSNAQRAIHSRYNMCGFTHAKCQATAQKMKVSGLNNCAVK